ncbi:MAG: SDR family oxidoreductase [Parvibaculaceae bacterium]
MTVQTDVADPGSVHSGIEKIARQVTAPCDIVINDSGVGQASWYHETSEDELNSVIDTNLTGVWRVAKAATSALKNAGKPGSIVNIASITALRPAIMSSGYAASKAAVDHLTRVMAAEVSRFGIRVNALAPVTTRPR